MVDDFNEWFNKASKEEEEFFISGTLRLMERLAGSYHHALLKGEMPPRMTTEAFAELKSRMSRLKKKYPTAYEVLKKNYEDVRSLGTKVIIMADTWSTSD